MRMPQNQVSVGRTLFCILGSSRQVPTMKMEYFDAHWYVLSRIFLWFSVLPDDVQFSGNFSVRKILIKDRAVPTVFKQKNILSYIYLGYFVCLCVIVCVCVMPARGVTNRIGRSEECERDEG